MEQCHLTRTYFGPVVRSGYRALFQIVTVIRQKTSAIIDRTLGFIENLNPPCTAAVVVHDAAAVRFRQDLGNDEVADVLRMRHEKSARKDSTNSQ